MKNQKSEHNVIAHTSAQHESLPASVLETSTSASGTMLEACDRLSQKLDELSDLVRNQMQARNQIPGQTTPDFGARENPFPDTSGMGKVPFLHTFSATSQPNRTEMESNQDRGPGGQDLANNTGTDGFENGGMAALVRNSDHLIDTLAHSRDGWQEQATGLHQALGAIMDFLESQAANAGPKLDVDDIMSRLRHLEEEQQNLRSQINANR